MTYPLSVNISSKQFERDDFVDEMRSLAAFYEYQSGTMILEITEYTMIQDIQSVTKVMKELHEIGFRFAIDDFGTGYSNLHYIQNLPIAELKIDKSFIDKILYDSNSVNLINVIMDMGKRFEYEIVVEGVETEEQAKLIFNINPEAIIQGYVYSKPISIEQWFDE